MSEELKPCPFCGSPAHPNSWREEVVSVNCSSPDCCCRCHIYTVPDWNRRADSDRIVEETRLKFAIAKAYELLQPLHNHINPNLLAIREATSILRSVL